MTKTKEQLEKEYNKFVNKQFQILKGHFERCMLRCYNKFFELETKRRKLLE